MWGNNVETLRHYREYEELNLWLPGVYLFIFNALGQVWFTPTREDINSDSGLLFYHLNIEI